MNADWVMVIITGVYVIATIFICWANIKAANASKEQLREMQKQFAETNRPIIELEFHYSRRTWYIARFVNRGNLSAQHIKINLDQEFIDSLPEESMKKELERIKGKECIIGAGQHLMKRMTASNQNIDPNTFWNTYNQSKANLHSVINQNALTHYIPVQIRITLENALKKYNAIQVIGCEGYRKLKKIANRKF